MKEDLNTSDVIFKECDLDKMQRNLCNVTGDCPEDFGLRENHECDKDGCLMCWKKALGKYKAERLDNNKCYLCHSDLSNKKHFYVTVYTASEKKQIPACSEECANKIKNLTICKYETIINAIKNTPIRENK